MPQPAAHAQRQDHAPPAEGARARPARGRHLDAGDRAHERATDRQDERSGARPRAPPSDAAHPPLRGEVRRAVRADQDPRLSAPVHRRGGGRRRGACRRSAPTTPWSSTYREHGHALARGVAPGAIMAEMYGKQEGCSRGRGGSMHLFDVGKRFYGGNAIVAGGLPLAVGLALADQMQGRRARDRLLLRRRRGRRGRVPRVAQSGGAVEAAGAVPLREQPLRHGHGAGAPSVADRSAPQGGELQPRRRGGRRHGRGRVRGGGAARRGGGARRTGAVLPRVPHLPLPGPLDVRPRAVPRQGRGRGVEEARSDRARRRRGYAHKGFCPTTSCSAIEDRGGGRGRRGGRVRRGRHAGSRSRI